MSRSMYIPTTARFKYLNIFFFGLYIGICNTLINNVNTILICLMAHMHCLFSHIYIILNCKYYIHKFGQNNIYALKKSKNCVLFDFSNI